MLRDVLLPFVDIFCKNFFIFHFKCVFFFMEMTLKMLETGFVNRHVFLNFLLNHIIRITLDKSNVNGVNENSIDLFFLLCEDQGPQMIHKIWSHMYRVSCRKIRC